MRLGEWNTSSEVDCFHDDCSGPVQDIPVELIIPQEGYNADDANQHNDIALLRLAFNAQFNGKDATFPSFIVIIRQLLFSSFLVLFSI